MALTVFALVAALSYAVLGTAGNGFELLTQTRLDQERVGWVGRQLRADLRYLAAAPSVSAAGGRAGRPVPIRIKNDNRGDVEYDQLTLLVREPGSNGISRVRYYIDETNGDGSSGHLIRESRLLLARDLVEPLRWDFGSVASWSVEVWDRQGNWRQVWSFDATAFVWPKAVRVSMRRNDDVAPQQWWMPVLFGSAL